MHLKCIARYCDRACSELLIGRFDSVPMKEDQPERKYAPTRRFLGQIALNLIAGVEVGSAPSGCPLDQIGSETIDHDRRSNAIH